MAEYEQLDFFHLLPGAAGGRALRDQRGTEHFSTLARTAALERTHEERSQIARKAAQERRRRLYNLPKTVSYEMAGLQIIERVVPYWPLGRPRKRPIFVHIEVACQELPAEEHHRYFIVQECNRYSTDTVRPS
jgi:hypothetical protein